jgi:putative transposase
MRFGTFRGGGRLWFNGGASPTYHRAETYGIACSQLSWFLVVARLCAISSDWDQPISSIGTTCGATLKAVQPLYGRGTHDAGGAHGATEVHGGSVSGDRATTSCRSTSAGDRQSTSVLAPDGARDPRRAAHGAGPSGREVGEKIWMVSFMHYDLGFFDHQSSRVECAPNPFSAKVLPMSPV